MSHTTFESAVICARIICKIFAQKQGGGERRKGEKGERDKIGKEREGGGGERERGRREGEKGEREKIRKERETGGDREGRRRGLKNKVI